jgi:flagellar hook-associated protein 2
VASTINSLYGNLVQASVVNVGPSSSPDYRISLHSSTLGPMDLDIQKTPGVSLQTQQTVGALAEYEVNSSGITVSSNTRSASIATGVTLNLLSTSTGPVDVTVTRSTSALSSALSSFTSAYNAAVDEIGKQHGQSAGPLQGQSIVSTLAQTLSHLSTYNSGGTISGLGSLGMDLGTDGHITFNSFSLLAADFGNSAGVTSFLGSASGGGFLQIATNLLNGLEDPAAGLLKTSQTDTKARSTNIGNQIAARQNRVNQLQITMQNQLAKADSLIASMEQQYSVLNSMFAAQDTANQAYSR